MRTVNLRQWGNSLAVRLPKSVLTQAGISGLPTEFNVEVKNDEIILKKQKKPTSLKELFKDFEIIRFKEIEKDALTGLGKMKHWHIFDVIAKKR